ncbi:MAG: restriction endonuclease subunit S [Dolichospermum sp.]
MNRELLKNLCLKDQTGIYGIPASAEDFDTNKVRYLRITDISPDGNLLDNDKKSVSSENIEKYILNDGDIVFARTGNSTGKTYYHESKNGILAYAGFLIKYSLDPKKVNPKYLKYFTISNEYRTWVNNLSLGSTRGNINAQTFSNCPILLPSRNQQDLLVSILSSLDDKIELNNRINSELENLAKTIYDYWFVQFDFPDENGTPYKSSGGKMVYNQELKREIPAGWEVKLLGDIGKNIKNVIKQTDIDPEISYIGLEHIPRKKIALDTWSTAFDLASDKLSFTRRDILFGKLRPYFHKVGVAFISGVCSTDILVLNSKKESYFGLFLMVVSSDNFINYVNLATEGTRMPRTKWEFMKQYLLAVPKEDINQKFNDILKPLISQMENNTYQNQQLTQLRDWLLPMLMNGQITVK